MGIKPEFTSGNPSDEVLQEVGLRHKRFEAPILAGPSTCQVTMLWLWRQAGLPAAAQPTLNGGMAG